MEPETKTATLMRRLKEGATYDEIAAELGTTTGSLRVLAWKARNPQANAKASREWQRKNRDRVREYSRARYAEEKARDPEGHRRRQSEKYLRRKFAEAGVEM